MKLSLFEQIVTTERGQVETRIMMTVVSRLFGAKMANQTDRLVDRRRKGRQGADQQERYIALRVRIGFFQNIFF